MKGWLDRGVEEERRYPQPTVNGRLLNVTVHGQHPELTPEALRTPQSYLKQQAGIKKTGFAGALLENSHL